MENVPVAPVAVLSCLVWRPERALRRAILRKTKAKDRPLTVVVHSVWRFGLSVPCTSLLARTRSPERGGWRSFFSIPLKIAGTWQAYDTAAKLASNTVGGLRFAFSSKAWALALRFFSCRMTSNASLGVAICISSLSLAISAGNSSLRFAAKMRSCRFSAKSVRGSASAWLATSSCLTMSICSSASRAARLLRRSCKFSSNEFRANCAGAKEDVPRK